MSNKDKEIQKDLAQILLSKDGQSVLNTNKSWNNYVESNGTLFAEQKETLALYQDLLTYTVKENLSIVYPYTMALFSSIDQTVLADVYRRTHPNQSHQMHLGLLDFVEFLSESHNEIIVNKRTKYPFICDLVRYERDDLYVYNTSDENVADYNSEVSLDLNSYGPVWTPIIKLFHSQYTLSDIIQQIKQKNYEIDSNDYIQQEFILLYRNPNDLSVEHLALDLLPAQLIELLQRDILNDLTYSQIIEIIAQVLSQDISVIEPIMKDLFQLFFDKGVILGSSPIK